MVAAIGKPKNANAFGGFAECYVNTVVRKGPGYQRIDVLLDEVLDGRHSIKATTTEVGLRYGIAVLGVAEVRWNAFGEITTTTGETFLYSENEEDVHENGVGLLIAKEAARSLMEWEPISERIITARFASKVRNITIIQCYAPTNLAGLEDKEQFYEQLQGAIGKVHRRHMLILMVDVSAKVGVGNSGREDIMGKEALGAINENGDMFIDFRAFNDLCIGGSFFQHRKIHKATWSSPDLRTHNQIDHITVSKKWKKTLLDV
ncbi:hypothetical protein ACROYT_G030469 [Oculina patagonica]